MLIEFLIIKYNNNNKKTIDRIYFIDLTKQYNTINKQQSKSGNFYEYEIKYAFSSLTERRVILQYIK